MAKEKLIGEKRRVLLKIPKYKMYKDYGNHWCVHVALSGAEADAWEGKLKNMFSTHVEKLKREKVPGGYAYAIYIHG
jgi:hypothetical protein